MAIEAAVVFGQTNRFVIPSVRLSCCVRAQALPERSHACTQPFTHLIWQDPLLDDSRAPRREKVASLRNARVNGRARKYILLTKSDTLNVCISYSTTACARAILERVLNGHCCLGVYCAIVMDRPLFSILIVY